MPGGQSCFFFDHSVSEVSSQNSQTAMANETVEISYLGWMNQDKAVPLFPRKLFGKPYGLCDEDLTATNNHR